VFPDAVVQGDSRTVKLPGRGLRFEVVDGGKEVDINFFNEGTGFDDVMKIGSGLQKDTLPVARKIVDVLGQFRKAGVGVRYSTEDRRHAAYDRMLKRAGFELSESYPYEEWEGASTYHWVPKATDAPRSPTGKPRKGIPVPDEKPGLFTPSEAPARPLEAPPAADRPSTPVETPVTPPAPPAGHGGPPPVLDALARQRLARDRRGAVPAPVPSPVAPPRPRPPAGVPERRAESPARPPIDAAKDRLAAAGLTPREVHVLVERARGRSQADIGSDSTFRRPKGHRRAGLGVERERIRQIEEEARGKAGDEAVAELAALMRGSGKAVAADEVSGEFPTKRGRMPQERQVVRQEREQEKAQQMYVNLATSDPKVREAIDANLDTYMDVKTGTWKVDALRLLVGNRMPKDFGKGTAQPATLRTRAVQRLDKAVRTAKENAGPESLRRIDDEVQRVRDLLTEQGEKQPGKLIAQWVPKLERVRKALGELKVMTRRPGESDFAYEERRRTASGAKTAYRDVMQDVKRHGKIRVGAVGKGEAEGIHENEAALRNIFSTDPAQKGGLHADEYIPGKMAEWGVPLKNEFSPVDQFVDLLRKHHLVEEGSWAEKQQAKDEAKRSLFEDDKPAEKRDPWDEVVQQELQWDPHNSLYEAGKAIPEAKRDDFGGGAEVKNEDGSSFGYKMNSTSLIVKVAYENSPGNAALEGRVIDFLRILRRGRVTVATEDFSGRPIRGMDTLRRVMRQAGYEPENRTTDAGDRLWQPGGAPSTVPNSPTRPPDPYGDLLYSGFPVPKAAMEFVIDAAIGRWPKGDTKFVPDADPNPHNPRAMPSRVVMDNIAESQPGARVQEPYMHATTTHAVGTHFAEHAANVMVARRAAERPDPFVLDKQGQITLADGTKDFLSDVAEAEQAKPGSQKFTPEQHEFLAWERGVREKIVRQADREGLPLYHPKTGEKITADEFLALPYFPRTPEPRSTADEFLDWVKGKVGKLTGRKPGSRQTHQQQRTLGSEAEGRIAQGVKYMDAYSRVANSVKEWYTRIADHRLVTDPKLGVKDMTLPKYLSFMEKPENVAKMARKGPRARQEFRDEMMARARDEATGNVENVPLFKGKMLSEDAAKWAKRMYGTTGSGSYAKAVLDAFQEARNVTLGADFSYATQQLMGTLISRPDVWVKSMVRATKDFVTGKAFADAMKNPDFAQAATRMVESGGSLGMNVELMGMGKGQSLVERIPVVGPIYRRATRAMVTAIDMAKVHLFMSRANDGNRTEWPRIVQGIENMTGQGRMNTLGMSPERMLLERATLLAPSYYRAPLKLFQQMFEKGDTAYYARKDMAAMTIGAGLLTYGLLQAAKSMGLLSDEEFADRLDIRNGKGWMVPVPIPGTDKRLEVGLGGVPRSIISMASKWATADDNQAPVNWFRGHSSMPIRTAWDFFTGEDFRGEKITKAGALARSVTPIGLQDVFTGDGTPAQRVAQAATGLGGLRSFPRDEKTEYMEKLRSKAKETTGKAYGDLSIPEQEKLVRQVGPKPKPERSPEDMARASAFAQQADAKRVESMTGKLSADNRERLKSLGKKLPSYDVDLAYNGVQVPLTKERQEQFENLLVEEYDRSVGKWPMEQVGRMGEKTRAAFMESSLEKAKARARARLLAGEVGNSPPTARRLPLPFGLGR